VPYLIEDIPHQTIASTSSFFQLAILGGQHFRQTFTTLGGHGLHFPGGKNP